MSAAEPVSLARARAERLTLRIRSTVETLAEGVESLRALIAEADATRAWETLGFASLREYLNATLDGVRGLTREQRDALVRALADTGMTTREIASIVGASKSTVARDLSSAVPHGTDDPDDRETPDAHWQGWDRRFGGFTLDVAAAPHNAKTERYLTREQDGLAQSWAGERVWCNPPFSDIAPWLAKARREAPTSRGIVMLLPANRTDQRWWHEHVEPYRDRPGASVRVEFIEGRIRFTSPGGNVGKHPPFGCCLLIWDDPEAERVSDRSDPNGGA